MKRRILAAALSFLLLLCLSAVLAGNLDLLMTVGSEACTLSPAQLLPRLMTPKAGKLFLALCTLSMLGIIWALFGQSYLNYRSKMYQVVPEFEIPMPEGQGQYGTAWFLDPKKYPDVFSAADTSEQIPLTEELTQHYAKERRSVHETTI